MPRAKPPLPRIGESTELRSVTAACPVGAVRLRHAAILLGMSRSAVWELVRAAKVRSFKMGRNRVIRLTEIQRLLDEAEEAQATH